MNRWKKQISVLLVAMLLAGLLSGCGEAALKPTEGSILTLNIAGNDPNRVRLVAAMREKFPDISFDVNFCTSAAGTEFINSTIRNGDSSDIIFTTTPCTKAEQKDFFLDLSGYEFVNNFDSALLQNYNNEDRIYQLPGPASLRGMIVNTTLFDQHGWKKPENFQELIAVIRQIRQESPELTPLAMSMVTPAYPFTTITTLSQCDFLSTPDGAAWEEAYLRGEGTIYDGWGQGLEMLAQLIDADAFDPERYIGAWDIAAIDSLADGTAAMGVIYADQKRVLELVNNTEDAYDYELLPFYGYNADTLATGVVVNANFGLSKRLGEKGNEKKLKNGLRVMEWLATAEAQQYMQTTPADVPSIKGSGDIEVSPYYQQLWDCTKSGYRAFMVYTGYEHLVLSAGQVAYDAILAGDSAGMIEKFVEVADAVHQEKLSGNQDPAVLGSFAENFTLEQTCQFVANLIQEQGLGDFTLVSKGGINEQYLSNPSGISTWVYAGNVSEIQLNITQPRKTDGNMVVCTLSGSQVKDLLANGKKACDEFDLEKTSQWPYYWSGLDVTMKKGKLISAKFNGEELADDAQYEVVFFNGDDPWNSWITQEGAVPEIKSAMRHTDVNYLDILRQALAEQSPIKAPEVLRK